MLHKSPEVYRLICNALEEDQASWDATSKSLLPAGIVGTAYIVTKGKGILAGTDVALEVLKTLDSSLSTKPLLETPEGIPLPQGGDGSRIKPGDIIGQIYGSLPSILAAERTALNFLQRMSGIASVTNKYVELVKDYSVSVVDTRKTLPGFRKLDKYAVEIGGGKNHRLHLGDGILIKDTHIKIMRNRGYSLADIIERAKHNAPYTIKVEIEVESVEDATTAIEAGADLILLDNMTAEQMSQVTVLAKNRSLIEASGGINESSIVAIAKAGVDIISIGKLTHSVQALDMSLKIADEI